MISMIIDKSCLREVQAHGWHAKRLEPGSNWLLKMSVFTPKAGISIVDHEIITLLRSFGTLKTKCLTKDWGEKRAGICRLVLMRGFLLSGFSGAH